MGYAFDKRNGKYVNPSGIYVNAKHTGGNNPIGCDPSLGITNKVDWTFCKSDWPGAGHYYADVEEKHSGLIPRLLMHGVRMHISGEGSIPSRDIPLGKIFGISRNYGNNTFGVRDLKVGVEDINRTPHFEGGIGEWE